MNTEFSEFSPSHKPRQSVLPYDGDSSFSSLDEEAIQPAHKNQEGVGLLTNRRRRYDYLQPAIPTEKLKIDPYIRKLQSENSRLVVLNTDLQAQLKSTTLEAEENQQYLCWLRYANQSLIDYVTHLRFKIEGLENKLLEKGQQKNNLYIVAESDHKTLQKLKFALREADAEVYATKKECSGLHQRMVRQQHRLEALQNETLALRERLRKKEVESAERYNRYSKLKNKLYELYQNYQRKIQYFDEKIAITLNRQKTRSWQDNFIDALFDLIDKVLGKAYYPNLSRKKKAKEAWRTLKHIFSSSLKRLNTNSVLAT